MPIAVAVRRQSLRAVKSVALRVMDDGGT